MHLCLEGEGSQITPSLYGKIPIIDFPISDCLLSNATN